MRNLVLVIVMLAAATAYADRPKYTRNHDAVPVVKPTARTKPIQPVAAKPPHPTVTPDDVLKARVAAEPIHKEQEAILIELIRDTPDADPDKPDFMFRLAEYYAVEEQTWRLQAIGETIHEY